MANGGSAQPDSALPSAKSIEDSTNRENDLPREAPAETPFASPPTSQPDIDLDTPITQQERDAVRQGNIVDAQGNNIGTISSGGSTATPTPAPRPLPPTPAQRQEQRLSRTSWQQSQGSIDVDIERQQKRIDRVENDYKNGRITKEKYDARIALRRKTLNDIKNRKTDYNAWRQSEIERGSILR
jgi:hypothetical protein